MKKLKPVSFEAQILILVKVVWPSNLIANPPQTSTTSGATREPDPLQFMLQWIGPASHLISNWKVRETFAAECCSIAIWLAQSNTSENAQPSVISSPITRERCIKKSWRVSENATSPSTPPVLSSCRTMWFPQEARLPRIRIGWCEVYKMFIVPLKFKSNPHRHVRCFAIYINIVLINHCTSNLVRPCAENRLQTIFPTSFKITFRNVSECGRFNDYLLHRNNHKQDATDSYQNNPCLSFSEIKSWPYIGEKCKLESIHNKLSTN